MSNGLDDKIFVQFLQKLKQTLRQWIKCTYAQYGNFREIEVQRDRIHTPHTYRAAHTKLLKQALGT